MMRKRLISAVLTAALCFGAACSASADTPGFANRAVNAMLRYTAQERKSLVTLIKPMFISDSGIDAIAYAIARYTPEEAGLFNDYIKPLLAYTDKESMIRAVNSVKLIDEEVRREYANAFDNRETRQLSDGAAQALEYFIDAAYQKTDGLETLARDDGVTAGVIAKLLGFLTDANGGFPLITDGADGGFALYGLSPALRRGVNAFAEENGWREDGIAARLAAISAALTEEERARVRTLGREVGFYTPARSVVPPGSGGSTGYRGGTVNYSVITDTGVIAGVDLFGADVIEAAWYLDGARQEFGGLDGACVLEIPVTDDSAMAYKITDTLEPVKYSFYSDGNLYVRIDASGYYAIRAMPRYFDDAQGDWGSRYIEGLYHRGIINGKEARIFAPEDAVSREEFVKLITELFGFYDDKCYMNFTDVNAGDWYYTPVAASYKLGFINGVGDGRFGVGEDITRQDICTIAANVLKQQNVFGAEPPLDGAAFRDGGEISAYAEEGVRLLYQAGVISGDGDGYFHPNDGATRREAAKIIYGVLGLYVRS
ncbi:MAG: S-layer homology domain-containing protein [Clostridiales bacterium]|jgi:hypothetical protein|nr:S-layer homology domain-containing protein [Clostridiales bacterium]